MKEKETTKQLDEIKHPRKHGKAKQIEKYTTTQSNFKNNKNELNWTIKKQVPNNKREQVKKT